MLDIILKRIYKELPNVIAITIHDSVMTGILTNEVEAVKKINPEVVYCATYGYSKKGPYGDKGALDDSIQAASGIAVLQSMVEGEPRYLPTIIADKTTAMVVVQSILAALFHKERTGEGQEIEVPMFESMVSPVVEHSR